VTTQKKTLGGAVQNKPGQWVQTERVAHEAWADLISRKPRAAQIMHILVAHMGEENAVVIPQGVLADMMGRSVDTVQRALRDLAAEQWIQIVRLGKGKEAAYVINDKVAWSQKRDHLRFSKFSAAVVASRDDQDALTLADTPLRRVPTLFKGEHQFPSGPGLAPPSQPFLDGMEPDLPASERAEPEQLDMKSYLESKG
jgi:hypothetical protein